MSLNEQVAQINDEGQLVIQNEITRNDQISINDYQDTNYLGICISHDEQIIQKNDERQADTQNEIGANDPISRNECQDTNYFGQSYFAK